MGALIIDGIRLRLAGQSPVPLGVIAKRLEAWDVRVAERDEDAVATVFFALPAEAESALLLAELERAISDGAGRFVLVTDDAVFGARDRMDEKSAPKSDSARGGVERLCEERVEREESALILRVSELYDEKHPPMCVRRAAEGDDLPGAPDDPCAFLHVADFAKALSDILRRPETRGVVHLPSGDPGTYGALQKRMIALRNPIHARCAAQTNGRGVLASAYLPDCHKRVFGGSFAAFAAGKSAIVRIAPEAALTVGALYLIQRFLGFDALLLAPMWFAWRWGVAWGVAGVMLAALCSYGGAPFMALGYLISAGMGATARYKLRERADRARRVSARLRAEANKAREQLRVDRERNSQTSEAYIRIFEVVKKLDTLHPDELLLRTLNVLEETLGERNVSIYQWSGRIRYARLTVQSQPLRGRIGNSIQLTDYPEMYERVMRMETFRNTARMPGYPAFCVPMVISAHEDILVMLWSDGHVVLDERLLDVITGLARLSLARAVRFQESNPGRYLPGTRLQGHEEFVRTLEVRLRMEVELVSRFLLLRIANTLPDDVLSDRLFKVARFSDVAGKLDNGVRYILMTQADRGNYPLIADRFAAVGIVCAISDPETVLRDALASGKDETA